MHVWLSMSEFTDRITISQMTPDPIAANPPPLQEPKSQECLTLWPLRLAQNPLQLLHIKLQNLQLCEKI